MNEVPQYIKNLSALRECCRLKRQLAISNYYRNPNLCQRCGIVIPIKDHEKVADVRKRMFCGRSCSSIVKVAGRKKTSANRRCKICGDDFEINRGSNNRFSGRRRCDNCTLAAVSKTTKGELRRRNKNWRATIQGHARDCFVESGLTLQCVVCQYRIHADVCHVKPVCEFADTEEVSAINCINNLVALCKNHHWEYDHSLMSKGDIVLVMNDIESRKITSHKSSSRVL